jgi:hypothetical protein
MKLVMNPRDLADSSLFVIDRVVLDLTIKEKG